MKRVLALTYGPVSYLLFLGVFLYAIAFWAASEMTVGHLVFALATTGYILVALQLEERDLMTAFGEKAPARRRA